MNSSNEDPKPADNMELLKQQASACCGSECGCHATGTKSKMRNVVGAIVLIAAAAMVARAVIKTDAPAAKPAQQAFALPAAVASSNTTVLVTQTHLGTAIALFSELNTVATNSDAVFVYLPGKEGMPTNAPTAAIKAALGKIESQGYKCALFTLKAGSPDYDKLASQLSFPSVLALVKGQGMSPISGEITESKLIQGFVAASSSGGCGPGAGPGCCPK